jgi:uncharacterized protein YqgV (UPF0045/DUF77 family)
MKVQVEVSLYPLRTARLSEPIEAFWKSLRRPGVEIDQGVMSTLVAGECDDVFAAIKGAFVDVAREYQVVMTLKLSNACPGQGREQS